ncbi:response regulator [Kamptonema cortianum]|nr:response regulator [Kamptonema cortianum]
MRILLFEVDPVGRASLTEALAHYHYQVNIAPDSQTGLEWAIAHSYELVVLNVPSLEGISLCRQLRDRGYEKLILLLATSDPNPDIIAGLDAGADDCIAGSCDLSELMARIRALLRRREAAFIPAVLTWGDLCFNSASAEVTYRSQVLSLTPKEYNLLELFLRNPQRIFSRSAIIDRLWSLDTLPTENAVTTHIKGLRQQLKIAGMPVDIIETVYGLGYRLKAFPKSSTLAETPEAEPEKPILPNHLQFKIGMIDGDSSEQNRAWLKNLQSAGVRWGFYFKRIADVSQAAIAISKTPLDALLVNFNAPDFDENCFNELQELVTQFPNLPVLAFAEPDSWLDRIVISRLGGSQCLQKNQPLEQILRAIATALPHNSIVEATVMAVNDDPLVLCELEHLLQPWGVRLVQVSDPQFFWSTLGEAAPDLLILDLEMPGVRGIELCRAVRQDPKWGDLPIIAVTATPDTQLIHQVFIAGADDFVSKPIVGPELITRVVSRLDRVPLRYQLEQIRLKTVKQPLKESLKEYQANLLLVDDQPNNLRTLTAILNGQGYKIRKATSGENALETVSYQLPDLILLDIKMPEMDGYTICSALKAAAETREIPVIFLSALDDVTDKVKAFAVGGADYISKPFQAEEVLVRIKHQLTLRRQQQQLIEQNQRLQWEIQERKRVEAALRESEARQRSK